MKTDKENIIAALKLWFREGDVFEVRVLDAVSPEWLRPHMESGYFDYKGWRKDLAPANRSGGDPLAKEVHLNPQTLR